MARVHACERACDATPLAAATSSTLSPSLSSICASGFRKKKKKSLTREEVPKAESCLRVLSCYTGPRWSRSFRRNRCYLPCWRHSWTRRHIPPPGANLLHRSLSVQLLLVRDDRGITGLQSPALCPPPAHASVSRSNNHLQQVPGCGTIFKAITYIVFIK